MKLTYIYGYNKEPLIPTGRWYIDHQYNLLYIETYIYDRNFIGIKTSRNKWVSERNIQEVYSCESLL